MKVISKKLLTYLLVAGGLTACGNGEFFMQNMAKKKPYKTDINLWPQKKTTLDPIIEAKVSELLMRLTLEEKVGQMIQPEIRHITPEEVRKYHIGSVLNGGGSVPNGNKRASVDDWLALADGYFEASIQEQEGSTAIPIMWGIDAVHGHNNVFGATLFPHNIGLGAGNNPDLIKKMGKAVAQSVTATGMDWTFAPTVAVSKNLRWGRAYESYSQDPSISAALGAAFIRGAQGEIPNPLVGDAKVTSVSFNSFKNPELIATAKHFIADGGTRDGDDQGDALIDEETLVTEHLPPYIAAMDVGVQTIMVSFNSWQGDKMHGQKYLLTDVLKERLGFEGLLVGDWNGHGQVEGCTNSNCPAAINAGMDVLMVPEDWYALYNNTLDQVRSGEIPMSRIDDAVRRILRVKFKMGLFNAPTPSERAGKNPQQWVGHPEHQALARQAVRESLVLLKNDQSVLPINPKKRILLTGKGVDQVDMQMGGWSLTWQGTENEREDFPNATLISDALKQQIEAAGGELVILPVEEAAKVNAKSFDAAILMYGESAYAEGVGDLSDLEFESGEHPHLNLLNTLKQLNIPTASLFLSGRPLWVNAEINASDAFVAAWWPGSAGEGVADVLLASLDKPQANYDFSGKLSFPWPSSKSDAEGAQAQFPVGYGLTYGDQVTVAALSEEGINVSGKAVTTHYPLFERSIQEPWQLWLAADGEEDRRISTGQGELGGLTLALMDKVVQEDARRITWREGNGQLVIRSWQGQNLTELAERNTYLQFSVQVLEAPTQPVTVGVKSGIEDEIHIDITEALQQARNDDSAWQQIQIPMACFVQRGLRPVEVMRAFILQGQAPLSLGIADIAFHVSDEPEESALLVECMESL